MFWAFAFGGSVANWLKIAGVHYTLAAVLARFFSVGFHMLSNSLWLWRKPATASVSQASRRPAFDTEYD